MRQLTKYAFANARIRAMLSRLMDSAKFDELLEAKDLQELVEGLKNSPYSQIFESLDTDELTINKISMDLLNYDIRIYRKVAQMIASEDEKAFVYLLLERYEIEQLKVALRIWQKKAEVAPSDFITDEKLIHDMDFKKIIKSETIEEIIIFLDKTPYKYPLMQARENFRTKGSLFYLEVALDLDYYKRLLECLAGFSKLDREIAGRILGVEIDIENINLLIRLRKYYSFGIGEMLEWVIPGGEWINKDSVRKFYATDGLTKVVESIALGPYVKLKDLVEQNAALIENFLYAFLLKEIKKALAGFPFTIGTVLGYLILKHKETKNIISILNAKAYGWNKEAIVPLLNLC